MSREQQFKDMYKDTWYAEDVVIEPEYQWSSDTDQYVDSFEQDIRKNYTIMQERLEENRKRLQEMDDLQQEEDDIYKHRISRED